MTLTCTNVLHACVIHARTCAGNSVLLRSEHAAASGGGNGNISIDMESLQRDQQDQMQLLEQQVAAPYSLSSKARPPL